MNYRTDFLVIGSGLAGLTFALTAAEHGDVALLTKRASTDASSSWAQGGIAGAFADDDSFQLHAQDTMTAGAGLCHADAVDVLVTEGPARIMDLISLGARFDTQLSGHGDTELALGREGGHSRNRIVHTADYTGRECERTLLEAVRRHERIEICEHLFATDLIVCSAGSQTNCTGAWALDTRTGATIAYTARATLLATGGSGCVYRHSTNPEVATGDGVAMAWRAGVPAANLEFVQFHPTTLYAPGHRAFLITEALRGEGAILRNGNGEAFMQVRHPLADLAPRDIVARAIVDEMAATDAPNLFLDATSISPAVLASHFPTVSEACRRSGIDIATQPIPIVPAQHYQCGGVVTDLNGATSVGGLYAAGEVACTGVHGANRLASNSLLEAMVFGYRAGQHASEYTVSRCNGVPSREPQAQESREPWRIDELRSQTQDVMQRHAGIVRTSAGLALAAEELANVAEQLEALDGGMAWHEARNIATTARLVVACAAMRRESRGLHYCTDMPESIESERHDSVLTR
ncbi:MAG: L-aspartate oxidase [Armatimonadetes bacterium]|nr:L-aspartate oxidase [Armatimonadota bacterium]MDE2207021.1 L-aspartate oxidase [Armatimonadota bacterium]